MAFKAGKDGFLLVDGVAGTPVNVTIYADSFDFPQPVDTYEVSTFGSTPKAFIPGLTDGAVISQSGPLDVAMGTFLATIKAAQAAGSSTSTITWGPAGSVSGQLKISAEAWLAAYNPAANVGGRVEYQASWQITGTVSNSTW